MISTPLNLDTPIRNNIVGTLLQLKNGTDINETLILEHHSTSVSVSFYLDAAKTQLVFTESSTAEAPNFTLNAFKTLYIPPDSKINFAPSLSTTYAQPVYFVTATFSDGFVVNTSYTNRKNMMFQQVGIETDENSAMIARSDNTAYIVPGRRETKRMKISEDMYDVLLSYVIIVPLNNFQDFKNLSRETPVALADVWLGNITNALYTDRYRGGNCNFYSADLDGTQVVSATLNQKKGALRIELKCSYIIAPGTDF